MSRSVAIILAIATVCRAGILSPWGLNPWSPWGVPAVRTLPTVAVNSVPVTWTGIAPAFTSNQYHAQDELGQASFGYSHAGQAATNYRDAFGNQAGSWSYIDPEGKTNVVNYVADSNGFRVLSNNLPQAPVADLAMPQPVQDTAEVAAAKAAHMAALRAAEANDGAVPMAAALPLPQQVEDTIEVAAAKAAHMAALKAAEASTGAVVVASDVQMPQPVQDTPEVAAAKAEHAKQWAAAKALAESSGERKKRQVFALGGLPWASPLAFAPKTPVIQPVPAVSAPWFNVAPAFTASQYHAQDELGQASFGYNHPGQSATNFRDAFGNQAGSWSYIDSEGKTVIVKYIADSNGFRVLSNNLPQAPVADLDMPQPVQDTPEVAAAKTAHMAALKAAEANASPVVVSSDVEMPQPVQDTEEVAAAKAEHFRLWEEAKMRAEQA